MFTKNKTQSFGLLVTTIYILGQDLSNYFINILTLHPVCVFFSVKYTQKPVKVLHLVYKSLGLSLDPVVLSIL